MNKYVSVDFRAVIHDFLRANEEKHTIGSDDVNAYVTNISIAGGGAPFRTVAPAKSKRPREDGRVKADNPATSTYNLFVGYATKSGHATFPQASKLWKSQESSGAPDLDKLRTYLHKYQSLEAAGDIVLSDDVCARKLSAEEQFRICLDFAQGMGTPNAEDFSRAACETLLSVCLASASAAAAPAAPSSAPHRPPAAAAAPPASKRPFGAAKKSARPPAPAAPAAPAAPPPVAAAPAAPPVAHQSPPPAPAPSWGLEDICSEDLNDLFTAIV